MSHMESRISRLENRVTQLEFHKELLLSMVSSDTAPLAHLAVELRLSREQYDGIHTALEAAHWAITRGETVRRRDFENLLETHRPDSIPPYEFAKAVLLADDYRYNAVFDALKADLNLTMEHLPRSRRSNGG